MRRSVWRERRTLKWIGLLLSVMMLGLWVFSVMFISYYVPPSGRSTFAIAFGRTFSRFFMMDTPGFHCVPLYADLKAIAASKSWTEFAYHNLGLGLPKMTGWEIEVPVWLLVVTAGLPTAILWRRDRRRPKPGSCKVCQYDLTGNESGICPECGTA